jgi:uncharacterized protein
MLEIVRQIRELVLSRWTNSQLHGISHWDRVYDYGKQLVAPGVDPLVVALFAYLHDSCRTGDGYDTSHGPRAAEWIDSLRETYLKPLSDEQIRLLKEACRLHTTTQKTGNPTVDACFDADRLDLWRADIIPDPEKMATGKGRMIAQETDYDALMDSIHS